MGCDYDLFWRLTPAEIVLVLKGHDERLAGEIENARRLNYELAGWITFAFHNPKKMPALNPKDPKKKQQSSAVDDARVRGFLIGLAQKNGK